MDRQIIKVRGRGITSNLAPEAFAKYAREYLLADTQYRSNSFSPVPYFLLCRAIELAIKSIHLQSIGGPEVKGRFGHNLHLAYDELPSEYKNISNDEYELLKLASDIYSKKDFEYFASEDALSGYSRFPELSPLRILASKIIGLTSRQY